MQVNDSSWKYIFCCQTAEKMREETEADINFTLQGACCISEWHLQTTALVEMLADAQEWHRPPLKWKENAENIFYICAMLDLTSFSNFQNGLSLEPRGGY